MLIITPREVPAVSLVNVPPDLLGDAIVAMPTEVAPVPDVLDYAPPLQGRLGGPKPAYGPDSCAGDAEPGLSTWFDVFKSVRGPEYPTEVPTGGAGMAPGRVPGE